MSKRIFHHPKDPLLDEQCKYLFRMANEMKDDEQRFNFVHGHISAVEDGMKDGEQKNKIVKSMASWALKEFNAKEKYKIDLRMLDFWKLLGKYSSDLKMEGVMENLHRVGHFNKQSAFYLMWAEHWAALNNRSNFDKIVAMCESSCHISTNECAELFRPLSNKYFGESSEETDTMALIKVIADRPEDVRRTLTLFPVKIQEQQPLPSSREEFSIFHDPTKMQQPSGADYTKIQQQQQLLPARPEEASSIHHEKANIQQPQHFPISQEEFSVFHDPTKMQQPLTTDHAKIQQQPLPARREEASIPHDNANIQQPQHFPTSQEEFSIFRDPGKSMICGDIDDITLSGAHGKFAQTVFTSTPRRSVAFCAFEPPMMEMDNDGLMGPSILPIDKEERMGGLFAQMPEIGGSKLQRRLSLVGETVQLEKDTMKKSTEVKKTSANEIMKALPNLKIGSTIMEVTEEDEKENSISSPHRKKLCQAPSSSRPSAFTHSKQTPLQNDASQSKEDSAQSPIKGVDPDNTHFGIVENIKAGSVNPWDEERRRQILQSAPVMVQCHEFPMERCPLFEQKRSISLGGEPFSIESLLGHGGFARVYKATSRENGYAYAIKYEAPPCPWEVYICDALKRRIPSQFIAYLMEVRDAYIFKNASAIVYEYFPKGTILDLVNVYKKNGAVVGGLLATFLGIHLARALCQVHEMANIIHADVKPDNVVLLKAPINEHESLNTLVNTPMLKLIDWGRSIDMNQFQGIEFVGKAGTENFDCVEMKTEMPWTFQTDFYGFCATMYVIMSGEYLVTFKYSQTGKIVPVKQLKRRMALYDLWVQLFDQFLNIANCKQLPKWSDALEQMERRLAEAVKMEPLEWKRAIARFNDFVEQRE